MYTRRNRPGFSCGCWIIFFVVILIVGVIQFAWTGVKDILGFPTATPYVANCYRWYEISPTMMDQVECAYGTVVSMFMDSELLGTAIKFTSQEDTFFVLDTGGTYPDLTTGMCVVARGVIRYRLYDGLFYMEVSGLSKC